MNLGAQPRPVDQRDIKLGSVQAPVAIPDVFLPEYGITRNFQGSLPTCGAHAASHLKAVQETIESGSPQRFSPRWLWNEIKQIDGYALESGTDMRSIFKTLSEKGALPFGLVKDNVSLPLTEYSDLDLFQDLRNTAHDYLVGSYVFFDGPAITFEAVRQAVFVNKAVLLLASVDTGFWRTNHPTFTVPKDGHFVVATGYNETELRIIDSAEAADGFAEKWVRKEDVRPPFFREAGVAKDLPNWWVRGLTSELALLRKLTELLILAKGRQTLPSQ